MEELIASTELLPGTTPGTSTELSPGTTSGGFLGGFCDSSVTLNSSAISAPISSANGCDCFFGPTVPDGPASPELPDFAGPSEIVGTSGPGGPCGGESLS